MKLPKKQSKYSYYSGYDTRSGRLRKDRVLIASIAATLLIIAILIMFNVTRIKLLWKGYSFTEASEILTLTDEEEVVILSYDKMDNILDWMSLSRDVSLYNSYQTYLGFYPDMDKEELVDYINEVFTTHIPRLRSLGYSETIIWELLETASSEDLQYLIDHSFAAQDIENYRKVDGYIIQYTHLYMEAFTENNNYNYSVNIVNFPFIISSNGVDTSYTITNPEELLTLVKEGFFLPATYVPENLVLPNVPISPDAEDPQLAKEAADALEEMVAAAEQVGYYLVLTSGYRSYERQQEIYESFEELYGGLYASEYVALAGASEHQTGLGIDLTSQSVIDGERLVFGDTAEYNWVLNNAHTFGFIIRYKTGTADITGIAHEPWHVRYVGIEVAQEIFENDWTFEEYCLYNNVIPKVTQN